MNLNTLIKAVIRFAPMAVNLARNETVQQMLKIAWNLYSHRSTTKRNPVRPNPARPRKRIRR
jgi:hypothetical protein